MSVLQCNRAYCKNIMCDRLSSTYGYICDDCFEELQCTCTDYTKIQEFMDSPKKPQLAASIDFSQEFSLQDAGW